ncbi:MAG: aminoglycoside phosphotransferase family protein [Alphaproteobacteria bacterium]
MTRAEQIDHFLDRYASGADWHPFVADASFRRYFRVDTDPPTVLMDAPPDKEDVIPFMAVNALLARHGFSAPRIRASDVAQGLLLLEDLGDNTFTRLLADAEAAEERLYEAAVDVLVALHDVPADPHIRARGGIDYHVPRYDERAMLKTASVLTEWYIPARTGLPAPTDMQTSFKNVWGTVLPLVTKDLVFALYDFHADNLMWLPQREGLKQVGLLDFQDAKVASPALDLVSLLQDCRRHVPVELEAAMLERYLTARPGLDREAFLAAYAVMGAQRNTRIVGVFTRLWKRDGKPFYPTLIPTVWGFIERNLEHPALAQLKAWFDEHCPPTTRAQPLPGEPS